MAKKKAVEATQQEHVEVGKTKTKKKKVKETPGKTVDQAPISKKRPLEDGVQPEKAAKKKKKAAQVAQQPAVAEVVQPAQEKLKKKKKKSKDVEKQAPVEQAPGEPTETPADTMVNGGEKKKKKKKKKQTSSTEHVEEEVVVAAPVTPVNNAGKVEKKKKKKVAVEEEVAQDGAADDKATADIDADEEDNVDNEEENGAEEEEDATDNKRPEGTAAKAFRRVVAEEWLGKKGSWDNSYEATFGQAGWGAKANQILSQVRGKDFRHEKTKKKRGTYRGGVIEPGMVASYKFASSDDEQ